MHDEIQRRVPAFRGPRNMSSATMPSRAIRAGDCQSFPMLGREVEGEQHLAVFGQALDSPYGPAGWSIHVVAGAGPPGRPLTRLGYRQDFSMPFPCA
jgi:hypothetical protein